jgi:glycolate oxidase iron-sulfur subunit
MTGNELESPRGRIYLVRSAVEGKLAWDDVKPHMDLCLGCRACETACPSAVEYGAIFEIAKDIIEQKSPSITKKALLASTTNPTVLKAQLAGSRFLHSGRVPNFVSKLLSGTSAEADLPTAQLNKPLPTIETDVPVRGEVFMLTGCAMQVLYPRVHECTRRLLRRIGYVIRDVDQGCCGALHAHNGDLTTARKLGTALARSFEGNIPIVVNSAGCGSTMKEYSDLIGPEANNVASRTFDLSEFLLKQGLLDELRNAKGVSGRTVTYHDACHLSHGQKITSPPRELIQAIPHSKYVELPESMMCCGSAGVYNVLQPDMARKLLDRKVDNIKETLASIVATGNPGCHAWIAQGCREQRSATVLHTAELLEAAFIGLEGFV